MHPHVVLRNALEALLSEEAHNTSVPLVVFVCIGKAWEYYTDFDIARTLAGLVITQTSNCGFGIPAYEIQGGLNDPPRTKSYHYLAIRSYLSRPERPNACKP